MLEHLRVRAAATMAETNRVTLATYGPADIQSDALPCRVLNHCLYLLVPRTSDHLLNIEHREGVLVTGHEMRLGKQEQHQRTQAWQLRGLARILPDAEIPSALLAEQPPEAAWSMWVEVVPLRLTLLEADRKPFETIDFE